ncbi:MAG: hypothetical protein ABL986_18250 [Vicinamibacterales bacterium]
MAPRLIGRTLLVALTLGAGMQASWSSRADLTAQAAPTPARSIPTFEVDRTWPQVPSQWKLGDPSSIAIDARDNV